MTWTLKVSAFRITRNRGIYADKSCIDRPLCGLQQQIPLTRDGQLLPEQPHCFAGIGRDQLTEAYSLYLCPSSLPLFPLTGELFLIFGDVCFFHRTPPENCLLFIPRITLPPQSSTAAMILRSYITWFEDNDYIGLEVAFPGGSTWKIERKIREAEVLHTQDDYEELDSKLLETVHPQPLSRFICKCIIPLYKTATQGPSERAKQADPEIPRLASNEIEALTILTQAKCSSSPYLIDSIIDSRQIDGCLGAIFIIS
ncbi:uncharacterized protein BO88DRAFT_436283 [Aspergillus vadensis CBS 113365]|uniref:Uncharacterized protein n=1 Tax=Aspergillus vadensis (strain CBS 113365 / IMI 142717 / IBT 24658) TaxID=1448311 RepID=A0A319B5Z2_ASPVC|nr:hypothetical protein BO88DRAFT_436283 [Aspergillus vadensis CBS 113365]PYH67865.1 hypothetical protein BO88DRAFT_436283 [Aspergillus vadensis CBS 113365]